MVSRSYALSRSDSVGVKDASPAWDQAQTAGLSLYVPVHATLSTSGMAKWSNQKMELYQLRSSSTSGFSISQDNFARDFPAEFFRKVIAETKELRPLYNGDFYPLTPITVNEDAWCAWQFDRPDLGKGFAMFFRRPKAAQSSFEAALRGLDPQAGYEATFIDSAKTQKLTGEELARLKVEIPSTPGCLLVTYRKLDK
jgi:alpha-galactosidase